MGILKSIMRSAYINDVDLGTEEPPNLEEIADTYRRRLDDYDEIAVEEMADQLTRYEGDAVKIDKDGVLSYVMPPEYGVGGEMVVKSNIKNTSLAGCLTLLSMMLLIGFILFPLLHRSRVPPVREKIIEILRDEFGQIDQIESDAEPAET